MLIRVLAVVVLLSVCGTFVWATGWTNPKPWDTRIMGIRVKGQVQRNVNDIKGVLYIYQPLGKKLTYHFTGKIQGDTVVASHTDGHVFHGRITQDQKVEGTLTTSQGHRIPVRAPIP